MSFTKSCSSHLAAFAADQKLGQNCVKETEKSCAINSEQPQTQDSDKIQGLQAGDRKKKSNIVTKPFKREDGRTKEE